MRTEGPRGNELFLLTMDFPSRLPVLKQICANMGLASITNFHLPMLRPWEPYQFADDDC